MRRTSLLCMTLLAAAAPAPALAQACLGVPTSDGQLALMGSIALPRGGVTYTGGGIFDLRGPFSIVVDLSLTKPNDVEHDIKTFATAVAFDISALHLSACPMVGFENSTYGVHLTGVDLSWRETVLPVSLGLGKTISIGAGSLTMYGLPQYLYTHLSFDLEQRGVRTSRTDSGHELAMTTGVRFRRQTVFGGASVGVTSFNKWKFAVYTFTAGMLIGSER